MKTIVRFAALSGLAALLAGGAGCQSQRRFASPEEALSALTAAAESRDRGEVRAIFGPRSGDLRSGDREQDDQDLASFRRALAAAAEIERKGDDSAILLVGEERWPFAVPLVREEDGWRFDTAAGVEELENRRIGRNELRTIAACRTVVDAQAEYRAADRDGDGVLEYAQRLMSTPGHKDGLYWESPGGVDPSPIGPVFAEAATQTDDRGRRTPYNGYRYRLLTRQGAGAPGGAADYMTGGDLTGGWAAIAWPDEYAHTGVMSFLVSHAGVVYEADLGPDTAAAAAATTEFNPVGDWKPVSP